MGIRIPLRRTKTIDSPKEKWIPTSGFALLGMTEVGLGGCDDLYFALAPLLGELARSA